MPGRVYSSNFLFVTQIGGACVYQREYSEGPMNERSLQGAGGRPVTRQTCNHQLIGRQWNGRRTRNRVMVGERRNGCVAAHVKREYDQSYAWTLMWSEVL